MHYFSKLFLAIIFGTLSYSSGMSQSPITPCASGIIHEQLMETSESYRRMIQEIDNRPVVQQSNRAPIYSIPVVIHVIHEGELLGQGSNISEEQVQSAMVALNEDFRKMAGSNGDGDGVDVELEFCLASRDPDGNSTNGIIRIDGNVIPLYAEQGIEATSGVGAVELDVKALSTWPREDYINVWIVNEIEDNDASGGVQGFAYFPVDNPIDGIVVMHNAFGTVGNLKPNTDENRTFTHEVGHYFHLYHTFHGTNSCDSETNCSSQGDRICDTPPTVLSASCGSPACGGTQQVENYMDYTPEVCRDMFTQGQKDRMRTALSNERGSLLNSLGCIPATDNDAGISTIVSPAGSSCENNITGNVVLTNYGGTDLTSVTINYGVDGILNQTYSWSGTLESGNSITVTLPALPIGFGSHTFEAETTSPNGVADQFTGNDNNSSVFSVSPSTPLELAVTLDHMGNETTWAILDSLDNIIASGGPYPQLQQGTTYQEFICVPTGCYDLVFYDTFGDGMGFTNGYYSLLDSEGTAIVTGGGNFGDIEINEFCYVQEIPPGSAPVANFSISDATICVGESINFSDLSANIPTTWNWSFENGTPSTSSQQNPNNISFTTAGTFEVSLTATNEYGTDTFTNTITVQANPTVSLTSTPVSCTSFTDGSVTSQVTGTSLTYLWSNTSTSPNLSNVGQGNYTLTVTTPYGCSASESTTVDPATAITATLTSENISCYQGQDGTISVNANGGDNSFTYLWNTGDDSSSISDISTGYYVVTVTDGNGCQVTEDITITAPNELILNLTNNDISCNTNTGTASINPQGGNGNYEINWSTGESTTFISNLIEGDYSVTVIDSEGCSATSSFNISTSENITVEAETTNITCFGLQNGQANIVSEGGDGNYTYQWSNNTNTSSQTNLASGTYSVAVTDGTGCSGAVEFSISQPEEIILNINSSNISCYGYTDGQANLSVSGGDGNYTYNWSNGGTSSSMVNLGANNYTITISDGIGCTESIAFEITEPSEFEITMTTSNISCYGQMDGAAEVTTSGGSGEVVVEWSNDDIGAQTSGLDLGLITATATDNEGCQVSANEIIVQPEELISNFFNFDIACGVDYGSAQINPTGGNGNYSINWSTGETGNSIENLEEGSYSVSISDEVGCTVVDNFNVAITEGLSLNVHVTGISCHDMDNGSAEVLVNGGTGNYSYQWNNNETTSSIEDLSEGNYSITVTDDEGCSGSADFTITNPAQMTITLIKEDISCNGRNDGQVIAEITGGTQPISLVWSTGETTPMISELEAGEVNITAMDNNGCFSVASIEIIEPQEIVIESEQTVTETCAGSDGAGIVTTTGGTGFLDHLWSNGTTGQFLENVTSGNYIIFVSDENECTASDTLTIEYDCDDINLEGLTKLIDEDCGRESLNLDDFLTCKEIDNAEMYQWKFVNTDMGVFYEGYAIGNNEIFQLQHVEGIQYDMSMEVCIRYQKNGNWSPFGDICTVFMKTNIPAANIEDADCLAQEHFYNDVLEVNNVMGAIEYEWTFTSEVAVETIQIISFINQITITSNLDFVEDVTYQVQVRTKVGNIWSEYGNTCDFLIESQDTEPQDEFDDIAFNIYPNPSDGEKIFIELGNLFAEGDVIDIELFTANGKIVETFKIITAEENSQRIIYHFKNTLASGVYLMKYSYRNTSNEKKLIVQ